MKFFKLKQVFEKHGITTIELICPAEILSDTNWLAVGSSKGTIAVMNLSLLESSQSRTTSDEEVIAQYNHEDIVTSISSYISPTNNNNIIVSSSHGNEIKFYDLQENHELATYNVNDECTVLSMCIIRKPNPDNPEYIELAYCLESKGINIIKLKLERFEEVEKHELNTVKTVCVKSFNDSNLTFFAGGGYKHMCHWNITTDDNDDEEITESRMTMKKNSIVSLCIFKDDGHTFVAGGGSVVFDGEIKSHSRIILWKLTEPSNCYHSFRHAHTANINALEFYTSFNQNSLVSVSDDRKMKFWNVARKQLVRELDCEMSLSSLLITYSFIYTGSNSGTVSLWYDEDTQNLSSSSSSSVFSYSSLETQPPASSSESVGDNEMEDNNNHNQVSFMRDNNYAESQMNIIDLSMESDGEDLDNSNNNTNNNRNDAVQQEDNMEVEQSNRIECQICFVNSVTHLFYPCGHLLCDTCIESWDEVNPNEIRTCPFCRQVIQDTTKMRF